MQTARCVMSIDVEDWFHILDLPATTDLGEWNRLPSRVEADFSRLLELASAQNVRTTCFFLGWVARRHPGLVRLAAELGHEIASHGYAHQLAFSQSRWQFRRDVREAKEILEDLTGRPVLGYRCPGFSVSADNAWVFEELCRAGYVYDSSVFPAARSHGGWSQARLLPHRIETRYGSLVEFPITVERCLGRNFCFFGGGYLRLFPLRLIERMARRVLAQNRPVIYYVHPREIDLGQPRLPMSLGRRFKSYVNLGSTEPKLKALLARGQFSTLAELGAQLGLMVPA